MRKVNCEVTSKEAARRATGARPVLFSVQTGLRRAGNPFVRTLAVNAAKEGASDGVGKAATGVDGTTSCSPVPHIWTHSVPAARRARSGRSGYVRSIYPSRRSASQRQRAGAMSRLSSRGGIALTYSPTRQACNESPRRVPYRQYCI